MKRLLLAVFVAAATTVQPLFAEQGRSALPSVAAPVPADYCVYYWCYGEWHTYATYATRCEANRAALNLQAQGYQTKIVTHY